MKIYAKCLYRNRVLGSEEYLDYHCDDWQPQDPNLILLMEIPEIKERLLESAKCWNCRWSVLFLEGLYSIQEGEGEVEGEPESDERESTGE